MAALSSALTQVGGYFYGLDSRCRSDIDFTLLLMIFTTITSVISATRSRLVGSLVVSVFVELSTSIVPTPTTFRDGQCLVALILILLIRPGLLQDEGARR